MQTCAFIYHSYILGILITGGSEHPTAVELYLPASGDVCLMPQISGIRDVSR